MINENVIPFPILTTDRLKLRQLLESDVEEVFSLRSDPIVNKYLDRQPSVNLDDSLNFIRKINESIGNSALKYWAIELKESKKLIGTICLFDFFAEHKKCEIGYELLTDFQGKGIMNEAIKAIIAYAFKTLGLNIIDACTHKENQNSNKLLQKNNFEKIEVTSEEKWDLILFRLTKQVR
ncbi:MAG TPA: GNAT family N-acetyltransferase [Pedobacter sp.]|nr:GNAT family N-acetyltransferase [Pedobacter sp.]